MLREAIARHWRQTDFAGPAGHGAKAFIYLIMGVLALQGVIRGGQSGMSGTRPTLAAVVGSAGHAIRAVLYVIIGGFLMISAWRSDSDEAGGLGDALDSLQDQPCGNEL